MTEPNSFSLVFTVFNRQNGLTYDTHDIHTVWDTEAEAVKAAEEQLERAKLFREDGTIEGSTWFWQLRSLSYRVHAFFNEFKDHPPKITPPRWMTDPAMQKAWIEGPGSDAL